MGIEELIRNNLSDYQIINKIVNKNDVVYTLGYKSTSITDIFDVDLSPWQYYNYGKLELEKNDKRHIINAIGHIKKSIHLMFKHLIKCYYLEDYFKNKNFPKIISFFSDIEAFPISHLNEINKIRNKIEHEYKIINYEEAVAFLEITELFLRAAYPIVSENYIGIQVGLRNCNKCILWEIFQDSDGISKIGIFENKKHEIFEDQDNILYYNCDYEYDNNQLIKSLVIKDNIEECIKYIVLMMSYTKYKAMKRDMPTNNPPNDGVVVSLHSRTVFTLELKNDKI